MDKSLDIQDQNLENRSCDPEEFGAKQIDQNATIQEVTKRLESISDPTEKLNQSIDLMAFSLAQAGNPDFKTFWKTQKDCLELFKGNILPSVKTQHWAKYRELTKEAKRLKEMFEEENAYAAEQIEGAILAIEKDMENYDALLEKAAYPEFTKELKAFSENLSDYEEKQRELNLLNAQAARVNALRKELIGTKMRLKQKNLLFQRLSAAGDLIFPKRKELIGQLSKSFQEDVAHFAKVRFSRISGEKFLQHFRDEIKALQSAAKNLTLNTQTFTQTRLALSECWDKLRKIEKERKKEQALQKLTYKENAQKGHDKILEFSQYVGEKGSFSEAQKKYEELNAFLRSLELERDQVKVLKKELEEAFLPAKITHQNEENKKRASELEKAQNRRSKIKELEERCLECCSNLEDREAKKALNEISILENNMEELRLSESDRENLTSKINRAKDELEEKEESAWLSLPCEPAERKTRLEEALIKKTSKRNAIKDQMDKYRRACGGSGLDIEKSLHYNDMLNAEKKRLEKINAAIAGLESQLAQ